MPEPFPGESGILMSRVSLLIVMVSLAVPSLPVGADILFENREPLAVVISAPISRLSTSSPEVAGTLIWDGDPTNRQLPLKVSLRGRSRLRSCQFPPLRLNFKRNTLAETPFANQNKLKLVTQCRGKARYRDYLELEYRIYSILNLITDRSLRVRWVEITFRDDARGGKESRQSGFLIEDVGRAATRLGMEQIKTPGIAIADLSELHAAQVAVFHFFVGNTDWSAIAAPGGDNCCHNGKPLVLPGRTDDVVVLPYDFDQAGLINAEYARPSRQLPIRSVRSRLYRGFCRFNTHIPEVLKSFEAQRTAIQALLDEAKLSRAARRNSQAYVRAFFAMAADAQAVERNIFGKCRG